MKKIITLLFIVISIYGIKAQGILDQAQKAYQDGDFDTAINLYQKEINTQHSLGKVSSDLYYNLGNVYFKANDLPQAILNYERALLYNPTDKDIKHNIEYANTKIEDKIVDVDSFSISGWFKSLQHLMSSNTWAIWSVISFLLFLSMLGLYFFGTKIMYKKIGFYAGLILFLSLILSNVFSFRQKRELLDRDTAIITTGVAPILSSPSLTSNEVFVLHAGTKVQIRKTDGAWFEIEIANGSVGWIQSSKLEII